MSHRLNWIRWCLTLALGWQLLGWAAPAYADTIYVVQSGDTLYRISRHFGISLQSLMAANHLSGSSLIFVGQQLVIPDPAATITPSPSPAAAAVATPLSAVSPRSDGGAQAAATVYTVKPGDYLHHIAVEFGVSEQAIIVANRLTNANLLMVGQRLVIPVGDAAPAPVQVTATEPTPASTPETATPLSAVSPRSDGGAQAAPAPGAASSTPIIYVVKGSDTLWGIARRFGVGLALLKTTNGLYDDIIYEGEQLVIPGPDTTPVAPPTVDARRPLRLPPWVPTMSWRAIDLYRRAINAGRNVNAFSVAGDCNSDYAIYLGPIAAGILDLSSPALAYLRNDVNRYWGSLTRPSLAVHGGYNSRSVMDPTWANPQQCKAGESPFACELRVNNPSIVFIGLGTGDQFAWRDFEKNYRNIIDYAISQNVLPVLVTKPDALESQQDKAPVGFINDVIRRLGQEYNLPVMDLWLAVQDWPNHGLVFEGGQDFHLSNEGNTLHNMMTLQTLDVIWHRRP